MLKNFDLQKAELDLQLAKKQAETEFNRFNKDYGGFKRWPEVEKVYLYCYHRGYLGAKYAYEAIQDSTDSLFTTRDVDHIQLRLDEDTRAMKKIADEQSWLTDCLPQQLFGGILIHAQIAGEEDFYRRKDAKLLQ